jgi:hypothetical protein
MVPRNSGASGGVKVLYEHAQVLLRAGVDARLLARREAYISADWGIEIPVHIGNFQTQPGDVLVWPEVSRPSTIMLNNRPGVRNVLFVQNHFYVFQALPDYSTSEGLRLSSIISSSKGIQRFLQRYLDLSNVPLIPCAIENICDDSIQKIDQIALMPRKRVFEAAFIKKMLRRCFMSAAKYKWLEIDDMTHSQVMAKLARSKVFLSLQRMEGFGLPALEAMAAGCLVVGFTGQGGAEYANSDNGIWVNEDDVEAAAGAVAKAVWLLRERPNEAAAMIAAGRRTAARYSPAARDTAVLKVYRDILREHEPTD